MTTTSQPSDDRGAPEAAASQPAVPFSVQDEHAMRIALDQAHNAWLVGEVPVGAVITRDGQVIATGYNRPITTHDPTAHAELVALRHAAQLLENYRLPDCELFVTLEPCAMCATALLHARFKRVVYGARDPKTGACGSVIDIFGVPQLNHQTVVQGGLMAEASGALLRSFFAERRAQQRAEREAARRAQEPVDDDVAATPGSDDDGLPVPEVAVLGTPSMLGELSPELASLINAADEAEPGAAVHTPEGARMPLANPAGPSNT